MIFPQTEKKVLCLSWCWSASPLVTGAGQRGDHTGQSELVSPTKRTTPTYTTSPRWGPALSFTWSSWSPRLFPWTPIGVLWVIETPKTIPLWRPSLDKSSIKMQYFSVSVLWSGRYKKVIQKYPTTPKTYFSISTADSFVSNKRLSGKIGQFSLKLSFPLFLD